MRLSVALALSAALASLWDCGAQARFAPPVGKAIRQIVTEERRNGAQVERFTVERRLTFLATPSGYVLELLTENIGDPGSATGAMFAAGMAGLRGKAIRYHMDHDGHVIGIDDEEAVWTAICDGIDAMAQGSSALQRRRDATVRQMSAVMRSLPPARRRAMFTSLVASIVAGPLADKEPGAERPVAAPGQSLSGVSASLTGREHVRLSPDTPGQSIIDTEIEGDVRAPGEASGPAAHVHITIQQRIDRTTGLIVDHQQTRVTTVQNGQNLRSISKTTMRLDPTVF